MGPSHVASQALFSTKTGGTETTLERLLARVNPLVDHQRLLRLEHLLAVPALELGLFMDSLVRPYH